MTVSVAPLLVAELVEFVTTTLYVAVSLSTALAIMYEPPVAPLMFTPFLRHW